MQSSHSLGARTTGEVVWRQFGSPVVNRWTRGRNSWFDERHGALLAELFDAFCRMYNDKTLREPLVLALHWYRHCNTQSSGKEGSLVLGMAALDLLSALVVVDRCQSMSANQFDELRAAKKLHALLKALDVRRIFRRGTRAWRRSPSRTTRRTPVRRWQSFGTDSSTPTRNAETSCSARTNWRRLRRGSCRSGTRNWRSLPAGSSGAVPEPDGRRVGGPSGTGAWNRRSRPSPEERRAP